MLEIQQVKCPSCGSPADADDSNCSYCFSRIPKSDSTGSGSVVAGTMFAFVIGLLAADWYLGMGLADWVMGLSGPSD